LLFGLTAFIVYPAIGQQTSDLNAILDSVQSNHPALKMYDAEVRAMDEAAKGAKSWMPPDLSAGLFMAPYDPRLFRSVGDQPGMGQFMIGVQQMIPNQQRLNADFQYMAAMSAVEKEKKGFTLNQLSADAKKNYYEWIVLKKQLLILDDNEKLLNYMIQSAEIGYKNGVEKINAYYKAQAALGELQNMRIMVANDINQKKYNINTLMNRDKTIDFDIDTAYILRNYQDIGFDSTFLYANRSDIKAIEKEISLNIMKQETERTRLLPEFGIRFENMYGLGGQPLQYTAMAMMRLPLVPWASKMNEANIESLKWKNESLKRQQEMIINESLGMAYSMRTEIFNKNKQIKLYEEKILPALRKNYQLYQLAYEQNTEELFELFDAWETLNMTQLENLKLLQELFSMQVELERILQIR
jgi:outer membrane protein TolC